MCSNVLVGCKTHFRSGLFRLVMHLLGGKRREAGVVVASVFWENIAPHLANSLRKVLLAKIENANVQYDLKKSPGKYVTCTKRLCIAMGEYCKTPLPSRRSWVLQFDTESVLQMFFPSN